MNLDGFLNPHGRYVLDDKNNPVPEPDMIKWGMWMQEDRRRVKLTKISEGVKVSTVFLGLDHRLYGAGAPLLFETMIFGGEFDGEMWRYATWDQAVEGHQFAIGVILGTETMD